ncbi:hypothetical protein A9D60_19235 [Leisingera sp. JC1]|nr:hypothetical protein A9D60_19235 [Leisingera sp. JC1]
MLFYRTGKNFSNGTRNHFGKGLELWFARKQALASSEVKPTQHRFTLDRSIPFRTKQFLNPHTQIVSHVFDWAQNKFGDCLCILLTQLCSSAFSTLER